MLTGGAYQVFLTSALGCESSEYLNVNTYPDPTFNITSSNPTTCGCSDGEIQFNGLDPLELYQITFNHNILGTQGGGLATDVSGTTWVNGLSAGVCNAFMISNEEGCSAVDSFTMVTLVDPNPIVPVVSISQDTICESLSQTSLLSVTNITDFTSVIWQPNAASNPFTATTAGVYFVDVIDFNNCPSTSVNYTITEGNCDLGIDQLSISKVSKIEFFNLSGVKTSENQSGVLIKVTTFNDGQIKTEKIFKTL